jgi:hypothetical protein
LALGILPRISSSFLLSRIFILYLNVSFSLSWSSISPSSIYLHQCHHFLLTLGRLASSHYHRTSRDRPHLPSPETSR